MTIRSILLLICLLASTALNAQMFKPGKLITTDGDTLSGLVAVQGKSTFAFKKDKKGERNLFDLKELASYEVNGEAYVKHVVEVLRGNFPEKTKAYLRVVVTGPISLLEYRGPGIFGKEHVNFYLHHGDHVPMRVNESKGNFKTTMRHYFSDYAELSEKIRTKELGFDNLIEIVVRYNTWYAEQPVLEEEVVEKKPKKEKKPPKEKKKKEKATESE